MGEAHERPSSDERGAVKASQSDSKGRIVLGSKYANKTFRVTQQPDGNLLLEPVVLVHEREAWLLQNPDALNAVRQGVAESREGHVKYLGSFAQFNDEETDS